MELRFRYDMKNFFHKKYACLLFLPSSSRYGSTMCRGLWLSYSKTAVSNTAVSNTVVGWAAAFNYNDRVWCVVLQRRLVAPSEMAGSLKLDETSST